MFHEIHYLFHCFEDMKAKPDLETVLITFKIITTTE